jgi:hypothetical protein
VEEMAGESWRELHHACFFFSLSGRRRVFGFSLVAASSKWALSFGLDVKRRAERLFEDMAHFQVFRASSPYINKSGEDPRHLILLSLICSLHTSDTATRTKPLSVAILRPAWFPPRARRRSSSPESAQRFVLHPSRLLDPADPDQRGASDLGLGFSSSTCQRARWRSCRDYES